MDHRRWEHGSDFHLCFEAGALEAPWCDRPSTLWGSGRDALRALLAWGRERRLFERVLAPSFFCRDVVAALARELPVATYDDAPDAPLPARVDADDRDVLLVVNTYGMRARSRIETRAVVVEDHTHDPLSPWAFESDADYAVASLRKTLPLTDGGVLWSPSGHGLPAEIEATDTHLRAAVDRLLAMGLKRRYLEGRSVEKASFRAAALASEGTIGTGAISGISALSRARLPTLPARAWRERRERNLGAFRAAFGKTPGVRLLEAPFTATLRFDSAEQRDRVRRSLIASRIYPAVLWPLETSAAHPIPSRHVELAKRLFSIHCDFRYDERDMERVAGAVRAAIDVSRGPAKETPLSLA
jgi:hypothetical protein